MDNILVSTLTAAGNISKKVQGSAIGRLTKAIDGGISAGAGVCCGNMMRSMMQGSYLELSSVGHMVHTSTTGAIDVYEGNQMSDETLLKACPELRLENYENDAAGLVKSATRHMLVGDPRFINGRLIVGDEHLRGKTVTLTLKVPLELKGYIGIEEFCFGMPKHKGVPWRNKTFAQRMTSRATHSLDSFHQGGTACVKAAGELKSLATFHITYPAWLFFEVAAAAQKIYATSSDKKYGAFNSDRVVNMCKTYIINNYEGTMIPAAEGGSMTYHYLTTFAKIIHYCALLEQDGQGCTRVIHVRGMCAVDHIIDRHGTEEKVKMDQAIDDLQDKAYELPLMHDGALPVVPPTRTSGVVYRVGADLSIVINEDLLDTYIEKDEGFLDRAPGAYKLGVDLFAAKHPLDHKSPETAACAATRHLASVHKVLPALQAGADSIAFDYDKRASETPERKRGAGLKARVRQDMMRRDSIEFANFLRSQDWKDTDFANLFPSSMTAEQAAAYREEFFTNDTWDIQGLADANMMKLQCKPGEADDRGRWIANPGPEHQIITSPFVHMIEAWHKDRLNHQNFKGLTNTGKTQAVGRFIKGLGSEAIGFGVDKAANDRTWTLEDIRGTIQYLETMFRGTEFEDVFPASWNQNANGHVGPVRLVGKYLRFAVETNLQWLFSGVSVTSLGNRCVNDTEVGAYVIDAYGEEAYAEWLNSRYDAVPCGAYSAKDFPSLIIGVTKRVFNGKNNSPVKHIDEGDDLAIAPKCKGIHGKGSPTPASEKRGRYKWQLNKHTEYFSATETLDNEQKNDAINLLIDNFVRFGSNTLGVCYEVVVPAAPASFMGSRSVIEVTSSVYCVDKSGTQYAGIPKPLKALKKLAWNVSNQISYITDVNGVWGILNTADLWRVNATKLLALAELNSTSIFVGQFFLAHARYCLRRLKSFGPIQCTTVLLAPRSLEARRLEEGEDICQDTTLIDLHIRVSALFDNGYTRAQAFAAVAAWRMEVPRLNKMDTSTVLSHLMMLDDQVQQFLLTDEHIADVRCFLHDFDIMFLAPEITSANTAGLKVLQLVLNKVATPPEEIRDRVGLLLFGKDFNKAKPSKTCKDPKNPEVRDKQGQAPRQSPQLDATGAASAMRATTKAKRQDLGRQTGTQRSSPSCPATD